MGNRQEIHRPFPVGNAFRIKRKDPRSFKRGSVAALAVAGDQSDRTVDQVVQIKRCELFVLHHAMRLLFFVCPWTIIAADLKNASGF